MFTKLNFFRVYIVLHFILKYFGNIIISCFVGNCDEIVLMKHFNWSKRSFSLWCSMTEQIHWAVHHCIKYSVGENDLMLCWCSFWTLANILDICDYDCSNKWNGINTKAESWYSWIAILIEVMFIKKKKKL